MGRALGTFEAHFLETVARRGLRRTEAQTAAVREIDRRRRGAVYLHGPVGQGKTLIMDDFNAYVAADGAGASLRCHYTDFMILLNYLAQASDHDALGPLEVVRRLRADPRAAALGAQTPTYGRTMDENVRRILAKFRADHINVVLIDEVYINNIGDAVLFQSVVGALARARDILLLMTSNIHPKDLYKNGLNYTRFQPFVQEALRTWTILGLDHKMDLRQAQESHSARTSYKVPGRPLRDFVSPAFTANLEVPVLRSDRTIKCDLGNLKDQTAVLRFAQVCEGNMGSSDLITLANTFQKGIRLVEVPTISLKNDANVLRRFIQFVDVCYERNVPLMFEAAEYPLHLIVQEDGQPALPGVRAIQMLVKSLNGDSVEHWWDAHFDVAAVDKELWMHHVSDRLTPEAALAIWNCTDTTTLTKHCLSGLVHYYHFFGLGEKPESAALSARYGAGLLHPPATEVTDVAFAVPRLLSRINESFEP